MRILLSFFIRALLFIMSGFRVSRGRVKDTSLQKKRRLDGRAMTRRKRERQRAQASRSQARERGSVRERERWSNGQARRSRAESRSRGKLNRASVSEPPSRVPAPRFHDSS
ncbi:hypothetical protein PUN28_020133 [Cardiocondyla obscurior]|uniref:Uncharacterized protein n=1 Tax=Cardiocondyla obscurior TaxID=286306 RepID=A0AAW2EAL9_9HYME